jgi:penicillin-binding protein 2
MKLMFPKTPCVGALSILLVFFLATFGVAGQSKKAASKKVSVAASAKNSNETNKKSSGKPVAFDNKNSKNKRPEAKTAAGNRKASLKTGTEARKEKERSSSKDKKERLSAKDRSKEDAKGKKDSKKIAESRKEAAERKRLEKEREAAILAERRRREQAAREARERKLAFERGLRTQTVANIQNDITEGEDLQVRQAAVDALGAHAGSVVVMEAQTGKVLTIVNQDWAVRDSVKPCSTIKLVTGVAGLNEGVISRQDGSIRNTPSRRDLDDALAYSDNGYFQRAGTIVGNSKMIDYARELGLGQPTGVNVNGETAGKLAIGNNNARVYSHGDDFEVSTIQLAVMVSAITNGGHRVIPRLPRNEVEKVRFQTFYRGNVDLPRQNLRRVIPGMMGAAEYGTARRGMDTSLGVAGKTGSCISKGSWVGLFTSVAPIEQPKYAVAVITRGQSERGRNAAGVASQIYKALARRIVRTDRNLAQTEFNLQPRNLAKSAMTAAADDEEDVDDRGDSSIANGQTDEPGNLAGEVKYAPPVTNVPVVKPDPKKLVTRTGSSKPTFPPVVITYDKEAKETRDRVKRP